MEPAVAGILRNQEQLRTEAEAAVVMNSPLTRAAAQVQLQALGGIHPLAYISSWSEVALARLSGLSEKVARMCAHRVCQELRGAAGEVAARSRVVDSTSASDVSITIESALHVDDAETVERQLCLATETLLRDGPSGGLFEATANAHRTRLDGSVDADVQRWKQLHTDVGSVRASHSEIVGRIRGPGGGDQTAGGTGLLTDALRRFAGFLVGAVDQLNDKVEDFVSRNNLTALEDEVTDEELDRATAWFRQNGYMARLYECAKTASDAMATHVRLGMRPENLVRFIRTPPLAFRVEELQQSADIGTRPATRLSLPTGAMKYRAEDGAFILDERTFDFARRATEVLITIIRHSLGAQMNLVGDFAEQLVATHAGMSPTPSSPPMDNNVDDEAEEEEDGESMMMTVDGQQTVFVDALPVFADIAANRAIHSNTNNNNNNNSTGVYIAHHDGCERTGAAMAGRTTPPSLWDTQFVDVFLPESPVLYHLRPQTARKRVFFAKANATTTAGCTFPENVAYALWLPEYHQQCALGGLVVAAAAKDEDSDASGDVIMDDIEAMPSPSVDGRERINELLVQSAVDAVQGTSDTAGHCARIAAHLVAHYIGCRCSELADPAYVLPVEPPKTVLVYLSAAVGSTLRDMYNVRLCKIMESAVGIGDKVLYQAGHHHAIVFAYILELLGRGKWAIWARQQGTRTPIAAAAAAATRVGDYLADEPGNPRDALAALRALLSGDLEHGCASTDIPEDTPAAVYAVPRLADLI